MLKKDAGLSPTAMLDYTVAVMQRVSACLYKGASLL